MNEAPPADHEALAYVLWAIRKRLGHSFADEFSIFDDDLDLSTEDRNQLIGLLEDRYGPQVRSWPWEEIAPQSRTVPTKWVATPVIGWLIALWLTWSAKDHQETRGGDVSLGHIAKVLEEGEWSDP